MMQSAEIRQTFFDFFKSKGHTIVSSAPIVIKDDPTLLFTNAGMNQFKDYFLGNKKPSSTRVADTQKCLRVSGKHNDLEEVGVDTYHHTMFEMLGNWSFGDYFKEEAIAWAWELLTEVYKIDKSRLYITVFEGDEKERLPKDEETISFWKKWVPKDRIIMGKKKDNFWEMGDTGPCGPCTEIHVDTRTDDERKKVDGKNLVNADNPQVIEIWNLVFIQFNRKKDGILEPLPAKHVDTGMGLERLVRVLQNKHSNYDTDIFTGTIAEVEKLSQKKYGNTDSKPDIAFRVIADHIRAICFTIADGQMPSNTGAGYVIRRILRRAVRYYFSYLDVKGPLLFKLVPLIAEQFKKVFSELNKQKDFVSKVVHEEEQNFLRTLEKGLTKIKLYATEGIKKYNNNILFQLNISSNDENNFSEKLKEFLKDKKLDIPIYKIEGFHEFVEQFATPHIKKVIESTNYTGSIFLLIPSHMAFELYDTYGFPLDLIKLIGDEYELSVDEKGFDVLMQQQKIRSRVASAVDAEDWVILNNDEDSKFVGYDSFEIKSKIVKYRKTKTQGKEVYQIVLDKTPFYAESGGQVGDTGSLTIDDSRLTIFDTKKENNLIIHFANSIPKDFSGEVIAKIDIDKRRKTAVHHSATHLLHAALRKVLGMHVQQKGSLVNDEHLRFDFSHFAKVSDEEMKKIESLVNEKIRENIPVIIKQMKKDEAIAMGAMALFGEKYGDEVRVVIMDPSYSIELCGGTHVGNTGELGFFKITTETAVGAGIRRIEAVSGKAAEDLVEKEFGRTKQIQTLLKNPKDLSKSIENLVAENNELKKQLEKANARQLSSLQKELLEKTEKIAGINVIAQIVDASNADALKKICFALKTELKNYAVVLAANIDGKPAVAIMFDENISSSKNLDASKIIKEHIAPLIKGGGGGQKTLATAGGQDASKLNEVIEKVKSLL